jgi:hypothetical protein
MSAILGAAVVAEANDRSNGKTECIYKAVSGVSPYEELSITGARVRQHWPPRK